MSPLGVQVLRALSRPADAGDYVNEWYEARHHDLEATRAALDQTFPGVRFRGRVLDVGCAEGLESVAIAQLGAAEVDGIDIRIRSHEATVLAHRLSPDVPIRFYEMAVERLDFPDGRFDGIVTMGSLEHFADPFKALAEASRVLAPGGRIYLTSGVWRGPWGAHMQAFTKVPWVHFLFSERTVMEVRRTYRRDGARRYHEVEGGLNRIGTRSFLRCVRDLGLVVHRFERQCAFNWEWAGRVPVLGEFLTHTFLAVLEKPA